MRKFMIFERVSGCNRRIVLINFDLLGICICIYEYKSTYIYNMLPAPHPPPRVHLLVSDLAHVR